MLPKRPADATRNFFILLTCRHTYATLGHPHYEQDYILHTALPRKGRLDRLPFLHLFCIIHAFNYVTPAKLAAGSLGALDIAQVAGSSSCNPGAILAVERMSILPLKRIPSIIGQLPMVSTARISLQSAALDNDTAVTMAS